MAFEKFDRNHELGSDFRCALDMDPSYSLCSGFECVENDVIKRLNTPKGSLFYAPDTGWSSANYVNAPLVGSASAIEREIQLELSKEERLVSSDVHVTWSALEGRLDIKINCRIAGGGVFTVVGDITKGYIPTFRKAE